MSTLQEAVEYAVSRGVVSTSKLHFGLRIGYSEAAEYFRQMDNAGLLSPADGARPREVLVSDVNEAMSSLTNSDTSTEEQS